MRAARLARVDLPEFGVPQRLPVLPPQVHAARLDRARRRARQKGLDALVVYADREHSANLSYLSGFDPRFEEAILVDATRTEPAILVGNECWGMAGAAPLPMRRRLYQDLSLPDQPRDRSQPLEDILRAEGIEAGMRIGVVGWKTYGRRDRMEVPAFLVDTLRALAGDAELVENATDVLIDADDGLRTVNEPEQLIALEYAACHTSEGVKRLLRGLRPGLTEQEAVALLGWNGSPLSCHVMLSAGPRAALGLLSPMDRPMQHGEPFTTAYGIWGALDCRAGFLVADAAELPEGIRDYVERLVAPYFEAVAEWYEALYVGQVGGTLQAIIDRRLGDPFFGIFLNPGHLIGLDEWLASPIHPGSEIELRSGMALQCDIIPATGTDYFTSNIEDGLALADAQLRDTLRQLDPPMMARVDARRKFMQEELGIELHEDVLPLSNIPAWLPPFLLDTRRAMTVRPA
jgi:Creatinase/Prolidase N-terminal domain